MNVIYNKKIKNLLMGKSLNDISMHAIFLSIFLKLIYQFNANINENSNVILK